MAFRKSLSHFSTNSLDGRFDDTNSAEGSADKLSRNRDDPKWLWKYSLVLKYGQQNNGNYNLSTKFILSLDNGEVLRLGRWLHYQILLYKRNALYSDRKLKIQHLIKLGEFFIDIENNEDDSDKTINPSPSRKEKSIVTVKDDGVKERKV